MPLITLLFPLLGRRIAVATGAVTLMLCGTGPHAEAQGISGRSDSPEGSAPVWIVDSTSDEADHRPVVLAWLAAAKPVESRWGGFVPTLLLACYPVPRPSPGDVELRLQSLQALRADRSAGGLSNVEIRFDSSEVLRSEFRVRDAAGGHWLVPFHGVTGHYGGFYEHQLQGAILSDMQRAHWIRMRFGLITDEVVTAEFYLGSTTGPALRRVLGACGRPAGGP